MEWKKGRKNTDAKPRFVVGEEKEDLGPIKEGPLMGPVHGGNAFKELDNELGLRLAKDNHSKTVSDILQKARRGFYQRSLIVKVRAHYGRHGCFILAIYGLSTSSLGRLQMLTHLCSSINPSVSYILVRTSYLFV